MKPTAAEGKRDFRSALASARRILNPGGLLIIGTPNEGAWWWQWAYKRDPKMLAETDHCQFYTAQTIGDKIKDAGLTLTETHHMGWGPPDWRLDGRIRRYKILDDLFSVVGRALIPKQASSLYLLATKSGADRTYRLSRVLAAEGAGGASVRAMLPPSAVTHDEGAFGSRSRTARGTTSGAQPPNA